jgi:hypothetical protein
MVAGRKRYLERRHACGLKAPGGRPPRIPDWLRRAVIEEAEKELAGIDMEALLSGEPLINEPSDGERLAALERYGVVLLIDELRLSVGTRNRNRAATRLAWKLADLRYERVERGDRQRCRLDELIESVAEAGAPGNR